MKHTLNNFIFYKSVSDNKNLIRKPEYFCYYKAITLSNDSLKGLFDAVRNFIKNN